MGIHSQQGVCTVFFFPFLTLLLPAQSSNGLDIDWLKMPWRMLCLRVNLCKSSESLLMLIQGQQKVLNVFAEWSQHTHLHLWQAVLSGCYFCLPPLVFPTSCQERSWSCTWLGLRQNMPTTVEAPPGSGLAETAAAESREDGKAQGWNSWHDQKEGEKL